MFEKLLSVILFIVLGFWLLGVIGRFLLRYWLTKKQRQMEEQMRNGTAGGAQFRGFGNFGGFGGFSSFGGASAQQTPGADAKKHEGEVTVEKLETDEPSINKKIGDYVDFEEVK